MLQLNDKINSKPEMGVILAVVVLLWLSSCQAQPNDAVKNVTRGNQNASKSNEFVKKNEYFLENTAVGWFRCNHTFYLIIKIDIPSTFTSTTKDKT